MIGNMKRMKRYSLALLIVILSSCRVAQLSQERKSSAVVSYEQMKETEKRTVSAYDTDDLVKKADEIRKHRKPSRLRRVIAKKEIEPQDTIIEKVDSVKKEQTTVILRVTDDNKHYKWRVK